MKLYQKISLILFGLFLTIVILEIGLRIGGFTILSIQEHRNLQSIKQKGACRIMCLGESTTQGQYPHYLEEVLNQRNIGIKFSVIDKGLGATKTSVILSQLEANLDKYHPDIVVTMMGINDKEGYHIPYEAASTSKIILTLRSFKTYKLVRLLWLHIITKLEEIGFHVQDIDEQKNISKEEYEELQREQALKKAIELNPDNDSAYIELGRFYRNLWRFAEAEQSFKKAIELNPNSDSAYIDLGWSYIAQGKIAEAEQLLKKAIELNPNSDSAYTESGQLYIEQGRFTEAEQSLKKAIKLNPSNYSVYKESGRLYIEQGRFTEAEQSLKKAIKLNPNNDCLYGCLAIIYREIGNNELSDVYAERANNLRGEYYNSTTVNNYLTLKQILDKRKIKLISMQYPMLNIMPLKKIFIGQTEDAIVFVDNEKIFKNAIKREGYKEYFKDMFGGDFGHCTEKGNRLLAENIANVILKEAFNKNGY